MITRQRTRLVGTLTVGGLVALAGCKSADKGSEGGGEATTSHRAEGSESHCGGKEGSCGADEGSCGGQ